MRPSRDQLHSILKCPCAVDARLRWSAETVNCEACGRTYPIVEKKPVLIRFERSVAHEKDFVERAGRSEVRRPGGLQRAVSSFIFGVPRQSSTNMRRFADLIESKPSPVVLIVGGAEPGFGARELQRIDATVISFDIYAGDEADFVADAHEIPLVSGTIDAVIVQAVLEHVLEPAEVVSEIHRVLKPDGLVYAETPFMQQVHEGPFDFTRFTESGHRWLFRRFVLLDSGSLRGPGTSLLWAIRYAFSAIVRDKRIAAILCLPLFWIRYLDRLAPPRQAIDGACDVYFLGRRSESAITPEDIIDHYSGRA
jgi:SAM-dependent methyltransferase